MLDAPAVASPPEKRAAVCLSGTLHWPGAWAYFATSAVLGPVFGVWLVVPSPTAPKVVALNVSCIDGIELAKIAMTPLDGRNR